MDSMIRQWTAASLAKGYTLEDLRSFLGKSGFPAEEIEKELALAAPFVSVAHTLKKETDLLGENLKKREALMKTLDHQMRALPHYLKPEKVPLPPFKQFLKEYYYPNRLGLFSGALDNCEAKHWTPRILADKVGIDTLVEIQYGITVGAHDIQAGKYKKQIKFGEFIDLLENPEADNNFYLTAINSFFNNKIFNVLRKDIGDIGDGYLAPEGSEKHESYKTRLLIGPKGTVSPLHYDLINNIFIQIYGRKLIRIFPALQFPYFYYHGIDPYSSVDVLNPNLELYPDYAKATAIEIEMGPGDCLFIPLGWGHHVTSLSVSISLGCINMNTEDNMNLYAGKMDKNSLHYLNND